MHVGLGGDEWMVGLHRQNGEFLIALGESSAIGTKVFLFPEWTELPRRFVIPSPIAREVVSHWITTGTLSEVVKWGR
jgi:hypothetical protein